MYWQHQGEGGAGISAQTAWNADNWRGDWGDFLIFDEFAFMHPDVWQKVGVPMLLDNDGEAWFISTPNRKNHFYSAFVRGNDPLDKRWKSFHFTSYDNPHLNELALEEITFDMTEDMIKQEILAQFLDNEGAVFRNISANTNAPHTRPNDHWEWKVDRRTGDKYKQWHELVAGVDWGKHHDYTVISVGCADCKHEVFLDRFNQIDYSIQRGRLAAAITDWNVVDMLAESNAMGEPNLEMLQAENLPVRGFTTTAISKPPLIENLKLSLERVEFQFLPDSVATSELEAYEVKISDKTGRPFYSAPAGVHDDTVIARALMLHTINSRMPAFL